MAPKKSAAAGASGRPPTKQMTFMEAQAKAGQKKAAAATAAAPTAAPAAGRGGRVARGIASAPAFAVAAPSQHVHVVPLAAWVTVRSNYDDYAQSSVISAASEAGRAPPPLAAAAAPMTRAMSARPGSSMLQQHDVDEDLPPAGAAVPIWESRGLEFVAAIKRLLQPGQALSVQLQEFLIHMVLNHHLHASDLSLRALNLLMQNATLFPPSHLSQEGPSALPTVVDTSHHLWTPVKPFHFEGTRRPAVLPGSQPELFQFYKDLWTNAERFCKGGAGGGSGGGGGGSSSESSACRPGGVLLLLYVQHLLSLDWQVVRRALALLVQLQQREEEAEGGGAEGEWERQGRRGGAGRRDSVVQDQMGRVIFACLQWRQMQLLGTGASRMLWTGSSQHEELLHSMVSALLSSATSTPSSSSSLRLAAGGGGGSVHSAGGDALGAEGLWGVGAAAARLGALAGQALCDLTRMYSLAERVPSLYPKADCRATDCAAICKLLLRVMAADGDSSGLESERSRAWLHQLKPQGAKLRLLRALSPDVTLRLLSIHLEKVALKAWTSTAGGVAMLPGPLQQWREYEDSGGLKERAKLDPVEVLNTLAPPPPPSTTTTTTTADPAAPSAPSADPPPSQLTPPASPAPNAATTGGEEEAQGGGAGAGGGGGGGGGRPAKKAKRPTPAPSDTLLDQVSQMLFRVSTMPSQRGGFTLWLSAFVLASLQHLEMQEDEEGATGVQEQQAALRQAVSRVEARLQSGDKHKLVRAGCDPETLLADRCMKLALEAGARGEC